MKQQTNRESLNDLIYGVDWVLRHNRAETLHDTTQFPVPVSEIDLEIHLYVSERIVFPDITLMRGPVYERYCQTLNI